MAVVRLTTCYDHFESHRIVDVLESEGIQCFVTNENFTTLLPIYNGMLGSGIQVMIDETDLEKAQVLLEEIQPKEVLVCPYCESKNIAFGLGVDRNLKIAQIVTSLITLVPVGRNSFTYYCKDCKKDFKI